MPPFPFVSAGPRLRLEPLEATRANGAWRTSWRVTNEGHSEVQLLSVRAPHARFRAEPADLDAAVSPSTDIALAVQVEAGRAEEVENAFVILVVRQDGERWRVMFRVRVRIDDRGTPSPIVESMTSHRVGFTEEV